MNYFKILLPAILILLNSVMPGQKNKADSLEQALPFLSGEKKVEALNDLSDLYLYINSAKATYYALESVALADSIKDDHLLAHSYIALGFSYINVDNLLAVKYVQCALTLFEELKDKEGIATASNVLGVIYYYTGEYLSSFEYHLTGLRLREEIGDEIRTATSYNNIALVETALKNYDSALDYLNKALEIRIRTNNKKGIGIIKVNIGDIYAKKGDYNTAIKNFRDALRVNIEIGNDKSAANAYVSLARIYATLENYNQAIEYFNDALSTYHANKDKNGIAESEGGLASVYHKLNEYDKAIAHAQVALQNAQAINSWGRISTTSELLQLCYKEKGDFKNAYNYFSLYHASYDSLKSDEKLQRIAKMELDYKIEKMNSEQELELNKQKLINVFLLIVLFLSVVIVFLIIKDLNRKKKINNQLNDLNKKLSDLNSTKDRFFSIIAHDLRGPFQAFLGLSDTLANNIDELDKEEIKTFGVELNSALRRQYDLLTDLLEWARMQSGNFSLEKEKLSLNDLTENVFDSLSLSAKLKQISLVNKINQDQHVFADENMLRLVLRNIVSNGIKFTNKDGFVSVSAEKSGDSVNIIIEDNGIGIDPEELESLFRIDVHFTKKGTQGESGTGLGLILCKEIIEKHSGEMKVDSRQNEGSRILISLPIENQK